MKNFRAFVPSFIASHDKPLKCGRKPNHVPRKRHSEEPVIVEERINVHGDLPITPIVVKRKKGGDYQCEKKKMTDLSRLDPKRKTEQQMVLRLKSQHKMVSR